MKELVKLLDKNLKYVSHVIDGDTLYISVVSKRNSVKCPYCGCFSSKVHSCYERSFQDLPIFGKKVIIILHNRKYFCSNPECEYSTFAEGFSFLGAKAKKTNRLEQEIVNLALNCSSINAAKLLRIGVADVGKSTVCNLLKKRKGSH